MSLHIFDSSLSADRMTSLSNALQQLSFGVNGGTLIRNNIIRDLFEERKDVTVEYKKGFIVTNITVASKKSPYDAGSLLILLVNEH